MSDIADGSDIKENIFIKLVAQFKLQQPFPDYVTLNPHQLFGRYRIIKERRIIAAVDKGLGKTLLALSTFESPEVHNGNPGFTVLIFTNEKGMEAYIRDLKKFPEWEHKIQLVYGDKATRAERWKNRTARYFVVTYAGFLSDVGARANKRNAEGQVLEYSSSSVPTWVLDGKSIDAVVLDEFHRVLRRHSSAFFKVASKLFRHIKYLIPLSGSAVSKGPEDLWAALHLVDPKLWSSYWKYVHTWCEVESNGFGKTIIGPRRDRVEQWRSAVRPQVFQCTKDMVGDSITEFNRDFLDVNMPPWQRKLHDDLQRQLFAELDNGEIIFTSNRLSALYKIRTALICPKALDESLGYGVGIESISDDALESELRSWALFTPFKDPIPYLKSFLEARGARVWVLQGGIGRDEQERRLDAWRTYLPLSTPERPAVILSTIKYGESWEIPETSYEYFLGYEYDPEDNKQAEARAHRIISPRPVSAYYVRHLGSYDEDAMTNLILKADNRRLTMDNWYVLKQQFRPPT